MIAVPDNLFDQPLTYPDPEARRLLDGLLGIDVIKQRLTKGLGILIHDGALTNWAQRHHRGAPGLVAMVQARPPLVILAGDVGTGKTAVAESIGDAIARQEDIDVTLYRLSLATRGGGLVGEMTKLISAAFGVVTDAANKLKATATAARGGVLLLIDEADALAQSREAVQMHHEDRAGVNALIRGIDRLTMGRVPAAVIMCTNRMEAIDPAVRRRAADIIEFKRPDDEQRRALLSRALSELDFSEAQLSELVALTGPRDGCSYGFTFSDITQRLVPAIVLDAYPSRPITFEQAVRITNQIRPTPPFRGDHTS